VNAPDQYLVKAKALVVQVEHDGGLRVRPEDLYIVWFAKTLGNWKALVSTDVLPGLYWEVTYNGAKREAYVDAYTKSFNVAIEDQP
jgi:hypothetical protein